MLTKSNLIAALYFCAAFIASVHAAPLQLTTIASGLNNPRHLAFAPNGTLYVAEAGLGAGDGHGGFAVFAAALILSVNGKRQRARSPNRARQINPLARGITSRCARGRRPRGRQRCTARR